jgi:hypothetical protein
MLLGCSSTSGSGTRESISAKLPGANYSGKGRLSALRPEVDLIDTD